MDKVMRIQLVSNSGVVYSTDYRDAEGFDFDAYCKEMNIDPTATNVDLAEMEG